MKEIRLFLQYIGINIIGALFIGLVVGCPIAYIVLAISGEVEPAFYEILPVCILTALFSFGFQIDAYSYYDWKHADDEKPDEKKETADEL